MKTLKEALNTMNEARELLGKSTADVPYGMRAGFELRQQAAKDSLLEARRFIEREVIPGRVTGIFAEGNADAVANAEKFLVENAGIVLNVAEFYEGVAEDIEKNLGAERIFQTTQHGTLIAHIREVGSKYKLKAIDAPTYQEKRLPNTPAIVDHVRTLVRESSGDTLTVLILREAMVDAVIANGLTGKTIPVLLKGSTPEERTSLAPLFTKSAVVEFPEEFEASKPAISALFRKAQQQKAE